MKLALLTTLTMLAGCAALATAGDDVYPPSYNIHSSYLVSSESVAVADTFFVYRTLINAESFILSGLYFSDNLPPEFIIAGQTLKVNGAPIPFLTVGPITGQISPEHHAYRWIVDSHEEQGGYDYIVAPGDTVELKLDLVCNQPGQYYLPAHSTVFLGVDTGFFATSAPMAVTVTDPAGVMDDRGQQPGPGLSSTAYPNPFNPLVTIDYSGEGVCGTHVVFSVFDIAGRAIERLELPAESESGSIRWRPDDHMDSGVYLYQIVSGARVTGGKLILTK